MRVYNDPKHQLSYESELLVTSLLPGSKHINDDIEFHLPYDVFWNGIKIDVKVTGIQHGNINNPFFKFVGPSKHQPDTIFVNVYMPKNDSHLFWVNHTLNSKYRYSIRENVDVASLAHKITELHSEYSPIAKGAYMADLDMTNTTLEVPKYLKDELKALAAHSTKPGHPRKSMKAYLIELVDNEKKKAKL